MSEPLRPRPAADHRRAADHRPAGCATGAATGASGPTVRDSAEADLPAITAIYAHHVRHGAGSFELDPPGLEELARRRAAVLANGFAHRVAEIDGEIVGFAYFNFFRDRPAYRFSVENSVYVQAGRQRSGIGRALLADLIGRAAACGVRQMIAVIGDSANTGSIGLHAACGFRFAGLLRASGWKFERWLDTVIMQREIGAGERSAPGSDQV